MKAIPYILILYRLALVPIVLALAYTNASGANLVICLLIVGGLVSDVFDGIIARKTTGQTQLMRRMDSQVDMLFWLSIGIASYWLHPEIIAEESGPVFAILGMEIMCYVMSYIKFGKETCTHAFLSKLWGLSLLFAFVSIIGFGIGGFAMKLSIVIGLISHLDRLLITLILPEWTHDVPSAYHAYLIRRKIPFKKNSLLN